MASRATATKSSIWPGKLVLKGILDPEDAREALKTGADGIVVSNHGGRNMDSAVASMDALPEIAEAVGEKATVILDSGVRRGSDIAKALALASFPICKVSAPQQPSPSESVTS